MKILFCLLMLTCNYCFSQINLTAGLRAYYPFSGNANDASGNNLNGMVQSGAQLTTDRLGNANSAYHFNGTDSRIMVNDNGALSTPSFSICYYFTTEIAQLQVCVGKIDYATGNAATYNSVIYHPLNSTPFFSVVDPAAYPCDQQVPGTYIYAVVAPAAINTNQWYCIVNTFENGIQKLYVDGVLVKQQTLSFTQAKACNNTNFIIGSWWQGDLKSFQGKIDDVRFYDRAINQQEVSALCSQPASTCTNWLGTPSLPSYANMGQINITGNKITVEATFNRTTPYSNGILYAGDLVSKHSTPADCNYLLRPNTAEITTSDGYFRTPDICEIELNKTYHAAMVYDGTTLKFYRNGFLMSQIAATGSLFQNTWQTRIGYYEPQIFNTNFIGFINEVRIWNVAKTQTELNTYLNSSLPNPTTQSGLVAYYTFDNLLNKQGNAAYDGVLGGSASINQTNPNCTLVVDSCATVPIDQCNFDFSYKQDACNPLTVQFFNIGNTPVNPVWFFGDGNTVSDTANPTHTYVSTGNYTVKYSVQNPGCTDTITKNISVNILKDNIILTTDTTICFGATKQLITAPSLSFCWSPVTYLSDPNNANPFTNTPVPITYYFTAEIPGSNLINNGDFTAGNTGFTSQYNFASPNTTEGQYFVGTNPQNWNASLSACADHTTGSGNMLLVNGAPVADVNVWKQTVTILPNTNYAFSTWVQALWPPNPAQLSFSINGGTLGNLITASLPTCTWTQFYTTWNSGNNTSATISIVNKNTFIQGNDFALDDISFSPVLIKRDSVVIAIDHPIVKASNDTLVCAGNKVQLNSVGATTYNWLPATGLSNAAISNPVATVTTTTQYIVSGTSAKGCSASDTVNVTTKPLPVITKTADTTICTNGSVQLLVTGGVSYQWLPVNGLNNPAISKPIASPLTNTTYSVLVTGSNSCTNTDSVKIGVRALPVFTISPPDTTCLNTAVQLNASGGDVYAWTPAALVSNPNIANPGTVGNANTSYTVVIKEFTCNTSATLNTSVTVLPVPVIKASKSNDINCSINAAQLAVSGTGRYAWSPAGSLNNNAVASPIATPVTTTLYQVTSTDLVTNCIATDTVTVFVNKGGLTSFFIPSAFSPNGDGINDCFKVKSYTFLKSVDISIYNRFGNLVFHSTTDNDCWDGMYKGNPAEPGNYVYYIKAEDNCEPFFKKGNLVLIR